MITGRPRPNACDGLTRARPGCKEEREFVALFANALNHATAIVATNPDRSFPSGSLPESVRAVYNRIDPVRRGEIQARARRRLSGSAEQRRRYFGSYGERDADWWAQAPRGLDEELKRRFKSAVDGRLELHRAEIQDALSVVAATQLMGGTFGQPKTSLEVGHFSGDMQVGWTSLTISQPEELQFRWWTEEPEAERGIWELFAVMKSGFEWQLAAGSAGSSPGAIFTIDLAKHLPPAPKAAPATYLVRVTPGTEPKMQGGSTAGEFEQVPGKPVGPPSNDVVITYTSAVAPPIEFNIVEIYRTLSFGLGDIEMTVEQGGPGVEEFWVMGFVQESLPTSSAQKGKQEKFGPLYAAIDPDGPRVKSLAGGASFALNGPFTPEWPRAYTVVISVIEEDDGGSLNEWQAGIGDVASALLEGDAADLISGYLEENFDDYIDDIATHLAHTGGHAASVVGSIIGSVTGGIIGAVIAAIAIVAAGIISDMDDDYYGTEAFVLVLPTNITDEVHKRPGKISSTSFYFPRETLGFKGSPLFNEAASWDGAVVVDFQFDLWNKEMFSA